MPGQKYALHGLSLERFRTELDLFWEELELNAALRRQAEASGIDLEEFEGRTKADLINVTPTEAHLDPVSIGIAVTYVSKSFWDKVALPWLQRKAGVDAIRPIPNKKRKKPNKKPKKSS